MGKITQTTYKQVDIDLKIYKSSLLTASVFLVKEKARSFIWKPERRGGFRGLREQEKMWTGHQSMKVNGLGKGSTAIIHHYEKIATSWSWFQKEKSKHDGVSL